MEDEISVNDLASQTGFSPQLICNLIKNNVLPEGRKDGRTRLLPEKLSKAILASHEAGKDWKQRTRKKRTKPLTWSDLI